MTRKRLLVSLLKPAHLERVAQHLAAQCRQGSSSDGLRVDIRVVPAPCRTISDEDGPWAEPRTTWPELSGDHEWVEHRVGAVRALGWFKERVESIVFGDGHVGHVFARMMPLPAPADSHGANISFRDLLGQRTPPWASDTPHGSVAQR